MTTLQATIKTDHCEDERRVLNALIEATAKSGATVFSYGKHSFYPYGFTAFIILGESHSAAHTFPENHQIWIEIVSCSDRIKNDIFINTFSALVDGTVLDRKLSG